MTDDDAPTTTPTPTTENGPETFKVKVDHFEGIQMLGEENSLEGAPNFRQVCHLISNNFTTLKIDCRVSNFWLCSADS